jgi:hypothetical protein
MLNKAILGLSLALGAGSSRAMEVSARGLKRPISNVKLPASAPESKTPRRTPQGGLTGEQVNRRINYLTKQKALGARSHETGYNIFSSDPKVIAATMKCAAQILKYMR